MDEGRLKDLVERGLSTRAIAAELGASPTSVRRALARDGLSTKHASARHARPPRPAEPGARVQLECQRHGPSTFVWRAEGGWRCLKCRSEAVSRRRRRVKEILVAEAGGACQLCGYSRCLAALEFHHLDPAAKEFAVGERGVSRALDAARREVGKCLLVCSNCHAELEAGIRRLVEEAPTADNGADSIPG